MKRQRRTAEGCRPPRAGFTLVEMLVSVALVLLIMVLFAQAFGIAAGSIRTQRGIAENDQRARSLVTILLGDLRKRTYRQREDAVTETILPARDVAPFSPKDQLIKLENRANRNSLGIVPLHPDYYNGGAGGPVPGSVGNSTRLVDTELERGYFHFSEGDPTNDADDILQFTVDMSQIDLGNDDTTPLIGRARPIYDVAAGLAIPPTWLGGIPSNPDQPIWDGGQGYQLDVAGDPVSYPLGGTGASESRYAEISYFLRGGTLYRRVMLIRDPLTHMDNLSTGEGQPNLGPTGDLAAMIAGDYDDEDGSPAYAGVPGSSDFWNDFDFSAQYFTGSAPGGVNVFFAEIASLDNTIAGVNDGSAPTRFSRFLALGNPQSRFGHDPLPQANSLQGRPKEHWDPDDSGSFIGRYTQQETSDPDFSFPGTPGYAGGPPGASPMSTAATPLPGIVDTAPADGVIDLFAEGQRQGEDILLSNCHGFDIKIWDDELGAFVDIGYGTDAATGPFGDYHVRQILVGPATVAFDPTPGTNEPGRFQAAQLGMSLYGGLNPAGGTNRVFDTWHPAFDFNTNREGRPGTGGANDGTGPCDDVPPFRPLWSERDSFLAAYELGGTNGPGATADIYLRPYQPLLYDPDPGTNPDGYDVGERVFPRPDQDEGFHGHQSFFYVATPNPASGTDGSNMAPDVTEEPQWPELPGATVDDGEIRWKAIPNTIGLKAIQITVRFYDPTSGQIRQLTLTHSFVEL